MRIKLCGLVIWAAMLAAGLVSCQQEDDLPKGVKYPILFGYYDTRAVADLDDLQDKGFKVYAYFEGNTNNYATFEKEVAYDEDKNVWGYQGLEYWIPGAKYWFKAFYPGDKFKVTNTSENQYFTVSDVDVVNHQVDLLVASATAEVPNNAMCPKDGSVVNLNFQHLLSNIQIKIQSEVSGIKINAVTIVNADNNGAYSSETEEWEPTATGDIEKKSDVELALKDDFKIVTGDGILVIPGNPSGKSLSVKASNGKEYKADFPATPQWEKGNRYTYTLVIKPSDIIFNEPKVDEWDSENATGSVIIK